MPGFSTLSLGGTIVSPLRLNYDLSVTGSSTVALAYSNAGITDIVGLQVVIYNNTAGSITLTAGTQFNNYTAYPNYCSVINQVVVPARQSITLITTVVGQDYTIAAISGMVDIDGGAAGNLIYQTAPNRTGFLATGTPNYILESNGINQPPKWSLLSTGNLAGGVAGSLVYQSAPNVTSKSAVGSAFGNGGGGIAAMNSSTSVGWDNLGLLNGAQINYSGGTITVDNPRAWAFNTSAIGGSSGNLYTFLNANNIPQYGGYIYVIYNDTSSNYVLTVQNIQNPNAWSNAFITSFAGGANQITIYPHETVTFQVYNSTYLTIVAATQSLGLSAIYTLANPSAGNPWQPAIGSIVYDPNGWNTVGSVNFGVKQAGLYKYSIYIDQANATSQVPVLNVYKNAGFSGNVVMQSFGTSTGINTQNGTYFATFEIFLNANEYIHFNTNAISTTILASHVYITLLN